ncbi:MAG TPA: flagellar basal body L-ring protein FlgH [Bryobacteraceae bacterium]|jgi:flagellar L-ring protein precursor FlgH
MKLIIFAALPGLLLAQSPGSLYSPGGRLADFARDLRAADVGDIVTIVVNDSASALANGSTNTSRKSSVNAGISSVAGFSDPHLANLLNTSNAQQLQGQGATTRNMTITTTISARVIQVTPNGSLLVEGMKDVGVNSEKQTILVKGLIRPADLTTANTIASNQVANLSIQVNGKGVVGDAIRRPHFLYRLVMGLLPF